MGIAHGDFICLNLIVILALLSWKLLEKLLVRHAHEQLNY